jgi:hypothetical protein
MTDHLTRKAWIGALLLVALSAIAALAGCGSSSDTTVSVPKELLAKPCKDSSLEPPEVRAIGGSCASARATVAAWRKNENCFTPPGASRFDCSVGRYRCFGAAVDRGIAVNCAASGNTVSFIVKKP